MRILFIGSFLSGKTGTKSIAEKLSEYWLQNNGPKAKLVSSYANRYLRLFSILLSILFYRGKLVNIDVFSGNSLVIAKLASTISKFRGLKLILTLRGGRIAEELNHKSDEYRRILTKADYIQTPSRFLATEIEKKFGIKPNYLPNPLKLDHFKENRDLKRANLLWVRAFSQIYNPDLAIKTLGILKTDFPELELTMIGPDKGLLAQTQLLVKMLGLERSVKFLGPVANEDLPAYYQSHSVYLNTTSYESFGTAVLEAAASALPIVSTKVGELPYLWAHDVNIKFADKIDADSIAKEVKILLKNPIMAMEIGKSAEIRAREFDWNELNIKWLSLIEKMS